MNRRACSGCAERYPLQDGWHILPNGERWLCAQQPDDVLATHRAVIDDGVVVTVIDANTPISELVMDGLRVRPKGGCIKGNECRCVGPKTSLRMFCPWWSIEEEPTGDLERVAIANWETLDEEVRHRCALRLRTALAEAPDVLERWKDQKRRGMRIGSHQIRFHFELGMVARNMLREMLRDDRLPPVKQPDGSMGRNWDDYYYGALDAVVDGAIKGDEACQPKSS